MERTVTVTRSLPFERGTALELPLPALERRTLARLLPLLRYLPWAAAAFGLLGLWVGIRVDVQALREDLDRAGRTAREARITNDRLRLELDARRRAVAMEQAAAALALQPGAEIVRLADGRVGGAR